MGVLVWNVYARVVVRLAIWPVSYPGSAYYERSSWVFQNPTHIKYFCPPFPESSRSNLNCALLSGLLVDLLMGGHAFLPILPIHSVPCSFIFFSPITQSLESPVWRWRVVQNPWLGLEYGTAWPAPSHMNYLVQQWNRFVPFKAIDSFSGSSFADVLRACFSRHISFIPGTCNCVRRQIPSFPFYTLKI